MYTGGVWVRGTSLVDWHPRSRSGGSFNVWIPCFLRKLSVITYFVNGYLTDSAAHANSLFLTRGKTTQCVSAFLTVYDFHVVWLRTAFTHLKVSPRMCTDNRFNNSSISFMGWSDGVQFWTRGNLSWTRRDCDVFSFPFPEAAHNACPTFRARRLPPFAG